MCSYSNIKQEPTVVMNSDSQFSHHTTSWLGGPSSAYISNSHSYYRPSAMQQHHMLSLIQENRNLHSTADPNFIPWPHNYHPNHYHHRPVHPHHQNFDWMMSSRSPTSYTCHDSENSAEESDDVRSSPSPLQRASSLLTLSVEPKKKTPSYDWMERSNQGRTRTTEKYRVVYTDTQRMELESEFVCNKYVMTRRKREISAQLGLSERQVKIWFQNRRAKDKRLAKKEKELAESRSLTEEDSLLMNKYNTILNHLPF